MLGRDQLYYVSLCEDHDSIRLAITPDEDGKVKPQSLQERWRLIEDFNAKLIETTKTYMPASELPLRYVPCSQCTDLHLRLDDIRATDKPLRCSEGKLPDDYYSDLRQYHGKAYINACMYLAIIHLCSSLYHLLTMTICISYSVDFKTLNEAATTGMHFDKVDCFCVKYLLAYQYLGYINQ